MDRILNIDYEKIKEYIFEYNFIIELYNRNNFCTPDFKKAFNLVYTVRSKTKEWHSKFYNLFAKCKRNRLSFKEVLAELYNSTNEIHASYCSKMIYLVYEDKPIWDQYVFDWLGFIVKQPKDPKERIEYCSRIYEEIEMEYKKHLNDEAIKKTLIKFDELFPEGKELPAIKKLDFILRSINEERTSSIFECFDLSSSLK